MERVRLRLNDVEVVDAREGYKRKMTAFVCFRNLPRDFELICRESIVATLGAPLDLVIAFFEKSLGGLLEKARVLQVDIVKALVDFMMAENKTRNIPREYRGSVKAMPSTCSAFIECMFEPLNEFLTQTDTTQGSEPVLVFEILSQVTQEYILCSC